MSCTAHAATTTPARPESRWTMSSMGSILNRPNSRPASSVAPGAWVTRKTPTNPAAYSHASFLSMVASWATLGRRRGRYITRAPPDGKSPSRGDPSAAQLLAHEARALHEGGELALDHPARRLPEAAVRVQPQPLGRHAAQQRADALGHLLGRLGPERLDVDHPCAQLQVGRPVAPAAPLRPGGGGGVARPPRRGV